VCLAMCLCKVKSLISNKISKIVPFESAFEKNKITFEKVKIRAFNMQARMFFFFFFKCMILKAES